MQATSKRSRKKVGFLNVKLSTRATLGKAWKRKWVVAQQNISTGRSLLLELYVEKGAYHKTVTSLLLQDVISVRRSMSKTQEHAIEIASDSKVLLVVSADSETDSQDWLAMFQTNLLPGQVKELTSPPGISDGFLRVSVIPNKDSDRLKLSGDYYVHVSQTCVNLYNTRTGEVSLEWDLRHLKRFMLISKCHQQDYEKIVHIIPSKRSNHGEAEIILFSSGGKQLVECIYERLSNAMTVKARRSRTASMLFEITPTELEMMLKDTNQLPERSVKEEDNDGDDEVFNKAAEEQNTSGEHKNACTENNVNKLVIPVIHDEVVQNGCLAEVDTRPPGESISTDNDLGSVDEIEKADGMGDEKNTSRVVTVDPKDNTRIDGHTNEKDITSEPAEIDSEEIISRNNLEDTVEEVSSAMSNTECSLPKETDSSNGTTDKAADDPVAVDATADDTGVSDARSDNAGAVNTAADDAGAVDAGAVDAGTVETAADDAGAVDAGAVDAGTVDTAADDTVADNTAEDDTGADEPRADNNVPAQNDVPVQNDAVGNSTADTEEPV